MIVIGADFPGFTSKIVEHSRYLLHATTLAAPELQSKKSKDELLALGEHYDIPLRKSWTNNHLIERLLNSGQKSEQLAYALLEIPDQADGK